MACKNISNPKTTLSIDKRYYNILGKMKSYILATTGYPKTKVFLLQEAIDSAQTGDFPPFEELRKYQKNTPRWGVGVSEIHHERAREIKIHYGENFGCSVFIYEILQYWIDKRVEEMGGIEKIENYLNSVSPRMAA